MKTNISLYIKCAKEIIVFDGNSIVAVSHLSGINSRLFSFLDEPEKLLICSNLDKHVAYPEEIYLLQILFGSKYISGTKEVCQSFGYNYELLESTLNEINKPYKAYLRKDILLEFKDKITFKELPVHANEITITRSSSRILRKLSLSKIIHSIRLLNPVDKYSGKTIYSFSIQYLIPDLSSFYKKLPLISTGYSEKKKIALIKAFGEAIERFSSGYIEKSKIINHFFSLNDTLRISLLTGLDVSFLKKMLLDKIMPSILVYGLNNENKDDFLYMPLEFVYYPYKPTTNQIYHSNSSGVAAGTSIEMAIKNSVYEYLERHFLLKFIYGTGNLLEINNDSLPSRLQKKIYEMEKIFDARFSVITSNLSIIPTFYVIMRRNSFPHFHLWSAAHDDKYYAINKSIDEARNSLFYDGYFWEKDRIKHEEIESVLGHYKYYHTKQHAKIIGEIFTNLGSISFKKIKSFKYTNIKSLALDLDKEFGSIYYADLSNKQSISHGLYVARIFTEYGIPLWFGTGVVPISKFKEIKNIKIIHPIG